MWNAALNDRKIRAGWASKPKDHRGWYEANAQMQLIGQRRSNKMNSNQKLAKSAEYGFWRIEDDKSIWAGSESYL